MSQNIIDVEDADFEEIVASRTIPVLIDFWAPWCGPCRSISPLLKNLSEKYSGQIAIVKCNIDNNPESPAKFGVKSIPSLLFFKEGELVDRISGATSQNVIERSIVKVLSGEKSVRPLIIH